VKRVSLEDVMDTEVRARIQKVFAEEAARYKMDELRSKKNEIMKVVEEDVTRFFKTRGITITTIAMFGGLHYENPEIQKAIDKVFQAQQDKAVAQAEAEGAKQRKEALKMTGEGEAQKKQEIAKGEAEAVKTVAEAKAFELEKLMTNPQAYLSLKQLELQTKSLEIWDGRYPVFFVVGGDAGGNVSVPNLLMTMPKLNELPAPPPNLNKVRHDAEKNAVKPHEAAAVSKK
jgi:regulator of protease activity HflC (stomatin/prohibitin superfamily)